MYLDALNANAVAVSDYLKLLSAPGRLMILCNLAEGEMTVGELCDAVDMKAPAMSQQLAILRRAKLIEARREAQSIYYSIVDKNTVKTIRFLHKTFCKNHLEN